MTGLLSTAPIGPSLVLNESEPLLAPETKIDAPGGHDFKHWDGNLGTDLNSPNMKNSHHQTTIAKIDISQLLLNLSNSSLLRWKEENPCYKEKVTSNSLENREKERRELCPGKPGKVM